MTTHGLLGPRHPSPEKLGEYQLLKEVARGGMGRVYLARRSGQAGFERLFAIKVMHQQLSDDPEATLMLLDEAHIASRLHHPHVVSVLDIGRYEGGYYLVMEYVEGCSLEQLLRCYPDDRPPRLIIPMLLDALNGLDAVHTLVSSEGRPFKIVHRDVSPHNLLLGLDGSCRVTDFGIAKATDRYTDTAQGLCKGKLAFMAPEQLRAEQRLDCRVDVWAAGVTLYAALTGQHPFHAESQARTAYNVESLAIRPPSEVGLRPPPVLDGVIMRALARNPDERYPSAQAFADALREVALAADLLGAPAEVARWVEECCGAEMAERRRQVAAVPRGEHVSAPSGTPFVSTRTVARSRRKQKILVVALAAVLGGALALASDEHEHEARAQEATESVRPAAAKAQPLTPMAPLSPKVKSEVHVHEVIGGAAPASVHGLPKAAEPRSLPAPSARAASDERAPQREAKSTPRPASEPAAPAARAPKADVFVLDQNPYLYKR